MDGQPTSRILLCDNDPARYHAALLAQAPALQLCHVESASKAEINTCDVWLGSPDHIVPLLKQGHVPRWAQLTWAGITPMLEMGLPRHYQLTRAIGVFGPGMLEYVLHHMLRHAWRGVDYMQAQSRFQWLPEMPPRLAGKRVLVAGLGSIGRHIADGLTVLGMQVLGIQRTPQHSAGVYKVGGLESLQSFAAQADYVINVLPDTPQTRDIYDATFFAGLNPECLFINIGRGAAVVDQALVDALAAGQLAGAVLDVFRKEPLPQSHHFWITPNLTLTPHISGPTPTHLMVELFLANLNAFEADGMMQGLVDWRSSY